MEKKSTIAFVVFLCCILSPLNGQWTQHIIDQSIEYHYRIEVYDIESDGDMDVFVAEYAADNVLFYEHNNNLNWTKYIIDDKADGVAGLVLADFDHDGNMDIVAGMEFADLVAWYKNDGGDPINWEKDTIDYNHGGLTGVWVEDIDGDGDPDAIAKLYDSGEMFWYENNLPVGWTPHLIGLNMQGGGAASTADMNGDNKPDLVRSVTDQNKVILFINNLPDNNWTEILIDGQLQSTRDNKFGDIDNDGDVEIVAGAQRALGSEADVAWYENDGSGETWMKHAMTSDLQSARGIDLADFDANDFIDIVVTDFKADDLILLLNEDGGQNWTESIIDNDLKNLNFVFAFDIDLDGDDDIIPSRNAAGALVWYENPHGTLFAQTLKVSPFWIQSQTDTLKVRAKVSNPENHPGHVFAVIQGDQTQYIDTLQLFDDGLHNDGDPSDNVWGNSTLVIGLPEDEFEVDLFTYDSTYGDTLGFAAPGRFITIGPVEYEGYTTHPNFICGDTIAYPGACLNLKFTLKNSSSYAMATNIDARLSSLDSLISIYGVSSHFDDLPAGESRDSELTYMFRISKECQENTEVPIEINISSYDQVCWRDTFSVFIHPIDNSVYDVNEPMIRIYPNPVKDILSIESVKYQDQAIEITSLNGRVLYSVKMEGTSHQIDLSAFQKGIYLITVRSKDFIETRKLIKIH